MPKDDTMDERLDFTGRVAIVTGAGNGLGREYARLLAERGASVVVNDLGSTVDGTGRGSSVSEHAAAEIEAAGGIAVADGNSVATPEGGRAIVSTAMENFGRVDIVVNNAGILRDKAFHNMTEDAFEAVLDVHLRGAFHVTQPAWIHMRDQGYGRIVNATSSAGLLGNFGQANYGAAKMGLVGLTRVLAVEGERHGIVANAIAPIARTRMTESVLGENLVHQVDAAKVAPMVAVLAHESCSVTGHVYTAGGGRFARFFVGMSPGWTKASGVVEPEEVLSNFEQIDDVGDFIVPSNSIDELRVLRRALKEAESSP